MRSGRWSFVLAVLGVAAICLVVGHLGTRGMVRFAAGDTSESGLPLQRLDRPAEIKHPTELTARDFAPRAADLATSEPEIVREDGETSGRIFFNIEVVNESGRPVKGATVKMVGMRVRGHSHLDWYSWGEPAVSAVTNDRGLARVNAPEIVKEDLPLGSVVFQVSHPDYSERQVDSKIDMMEKVVLEEKRSFDLILTDEVSSSPLMGNIELTFSGWFKPKWSQMPDGVIRVTEVSGNSILFYASSSDGGSTVTSDFVKVSLPRQTQEPVYVTLHPTFTVKCRLSEDVPRPVANGVVEAVHEVSRGTMGRYLYRKVDVAPDGTFELPDMTTGTIQIWALADGWCSDFPDKTRAWSYGQPLRFELTPENNEYVLPMIKTATAKLRMVQKDGSPAAGAVVGASPNMVVGGSGIWARNREEFITTATAEGVAVIENLPPLIAMSFGVIGDYELMPERADGFGVLRREVEFDMAPGQVLERTITVYPKGYVIIKEGRDRMTTAPGPAYTGP